MRFTLKDYQTDAVAEILETLGHARSDWHAERKRRTSFALSSTTGSGKTVIAATVIESLLHGSDEFGVEADPSAVVLWVSKDPSLNEQTRSRFIECADRIPTSDLVLLDKTYSEESLQTGTVYFINPAKLGKKADFVRHTESRQVTFWEILANTVNDPDKTLYLVLDEAHEGMREASGDDQTIVQKIINGNGSNPPVPIVWGISATVKRFDEAMSKAEKFSKDPNVVIDPKDVQNSGLLKNALSLDIPDEDGDFSTTMIRDATLDFVEVCEQWDRYCDVEGVDPVVPLLVVQIPNRAAGERDSEKGRREEDDDIHTALETIRKNWPDMPEDCVAHVLGDRARIDVGSYEIPRVAPQDVEHKQWIRVLVAKDAVSTGWDCPRAEVLVSLRPGQEDQYITQLLGRMVRTPLAQQTSVDRLNTASCYLPKFDKGTAKVVAEEIMGMREPRTDTAGTTVRKVMLKPVTLQRNPELDEAVFDIVANLPSFAKPAQMPKPVKRLLKLSQVLAQDDIVEGADKQAHADMYRVLDQIAEDNKDQLEAVAQEIRTADIRRILAERGDTQADVEETDRRRADDTAVDDALRNVRRLLTTSVVNGYLARDSQAAIKEALEENEDPSQVDVTGIRARVAALAFIDADVQRKVEDAADALTRYWLTSKAAEIAAVSDFRRSHYDAVQDMGRQPEKAMIEIKTEERVDSVDTELNPLPTEQKHLLAKSDGAYPLDIKLNSWERAVIAAEVPSCAAWYRNPSSAGKDSLRIAHQDGDAWKSVQPDLIFIDDDLKSSIIDPHGAHLGDASRKLKALAEYADEHGDRFERIVAIGIERGGVLYGVNLLDPAIRRAVYESPADRTSIEQIFEHHGAQHCTITTS